MIIFGLRHYGAVDGIGDGREVVTRFLHIMFVPILPMATSSVLVVESTYDGVRGIELPLSLKSVFMAYLRAATFLYSGFAFFSGFGAVLFLLRTGRPSALLWASAFLCSGLAAFVVFLASYGLGRPSSRRREELEALLM